MYPQNIGYSDSLGLCSDPSLVTRVGGGAVDTAYVPNIFTRGLIGVGGAPNADLSYAQVTSGVPIGNSFQAGMSTGNQKSLLDILKQYAYYDSLLNPKSESSDDEGDSSSDDTLDSRSGHSKKFDDRLKEIADRLNCDPDDILKVMKAESGVCADAVNKKSKATGLIQFMPSTAKALGTSVEELKKMSPVEQLDYVEKYLVDAKKTGKFSKGARLNEADLYSLVFMPAKANKFELCAKGSDAYEANQGLDMDKDGKITKMDLKKRLNNC